MPPCKRSMLLPLPFPPLPCCTGTCAALLNPLQALDTLVLLMGGSNLAIICEQLQQHGKPADTPVAVVHDATLDSQSVWRGTLDSIATQTDGERLSPCIIVVGRVAGLGL